MKTEKKRPFRSYFSNNLWLKILSLVFAVILWSFTITQTNPQRTKTFTEVPITIVGISDLQKQGLTLREDFDDSITVTVKASIAHSDFRRVAKNYISAIVDISKLASAGTVNMPINVSINNSADISSISVSPSTVPVTIDNFISKDVPVAIQKTGELDENLISLAPNYPDSISISGSAYYVEKIAKANVDIDLSTLSDGDVLNSVCKFTDEKNNIIKFSSGKSITVDMDIQTVKEVPINAESAIVNSDQLASGYHLASVSAGKIKICAHKVELDKIDELVPDKIDIKGKDYQFTSSPLTFTLPEGVTVLPGQDSPVASFVISESTATLTVKRQITVTGLQQNCSATLISGNITKKISGDGATPIEASVELSGPKIVLDSITASDVIVKLQLTGKDPDTYEIEPIVILSSSIASKVTAKLNSPTQVSVSIKQN